MILRMMIGTGARGLLNYIANPSKTANSHTQPLYTNMAGQTPRELGQEISALRKLRPNLKKAVAHLVLASDPKDRQLTEVEWKHAISVALKVHCAEGAAFAAFQHHDTDHQHIHIFF